MGFSDELLWFGLRGCLYCGSIFRKADGLCDYCSKSLWEASSETEIHFQQLDGDLKERPLEVVSLFEWIPGQQEVLSRLVMALKGHDRRALWKYYAQCFWQRHLISFPAVDKRILLVPSPSRTLRVDHASLFTLGLQEAMGGAICNVLQREPDFIEQKRKSKEQRLAVRFQWAENFSAAQFRRLSRGHRIVFVDDVVTTGSTAKAAWKALGKPEDFTIWSLAQRSLSCGASMNLI